MAAHAWRGDLATTGAAVSPAYAIREGLAELREIEQAFLCPQDRRIGVLVVINEKDYDAMSRIFEREREIVEALPGIDVNFELIIRNGRPLQEIVQPRGTLLF